MRLELRVTITGYVEVEVDDKFEKMLDDELSTPLDVDDFERITGQTFDEITDLPNSAELMEITDIEVVD